MSNGDEDKKVLIIQITRKRNSRRKMAMAVNRMTVDKAWDERHLKAIEDTNRHMIIRIPAKVANHTVLNIIL